MRPSSLPPMDVSRINLGYLSLYQEPLDLGGLTTRVIEEIRMTAEHRAIQVTLPSDACLVMGDSQRLKQVIINLVQNALKYSPRGGVTQVAVGCDPDTSWVAVQDHGLGIPAAALPHLFERFYRVTQGTAEVLPGMGLGLAVVHEIVTLHGGTITVESTEGVGSTFRVALPRGQSPTPPDRDGDQSQPLGA